MIFFPSLLKDRLLQSHTASLHMKKSTWFLEDSDFMLDLNERQKKKGSFLLTSLGLQNKTIKIKSIRLVDLKFNFKYVCFAKQNNNTNTTKVALLNSVDFLFKPQKD